MGLVVNLFIGTFMIVLAVIFQAVVLDTIMRRADEVSKVLRRVVKDHWKPLFLSIIVLGVFAVQVVVIWIWAALYMLLSCAPLSSLSQALYFSSVMYTTLGLGDITLEESCRILSGIEAANGFILFGWTTVFIFEIVGQIYQKEAKSL